MATQQANKAKWVPPHMRKVATSPIIATITEKVEKQIEEPVKKSQWTPPHLRKAQDAPVTPISKPAHSRQLNANSPDFKPVAFMNNNSSSSIRSIAPSPAPAENVSPSAVKSASPAPAESAFPVSAKSNASSNSAVPRKTVFGMGLAGSKWAPVRPTADQIKKAEAPEVILKAHADLMAVCVVMDSQQEIVDKRKKEALENGGEGLRYVSDYRKIQEEIEQNVAEVAKKIFAAKTEAAHSRTASDESQFIFWQRPSTPIDAPSKAASTNKESTQVQDYPAVEKSIEVQSPTKCAPNTGRVDESVSSEAPAATTLASSVKESAQAQDYPAVEKSIEVVEEVVSSFKEPPATKPAVGLSTNLTQWNSKPKSQKTSSGSVARPKTVAFIACPPAKSSPALSISGSTGGSQKDDEQSNAAQSTGAHSNADQSTTAPSIAAQSTAPGLTAGTTASDCSSHSQVEDTAMATTSKMLLPASITPYKPQTAAPVLSESIAIAPASPQHITMPEIQHAAAPVASEPVTSSKLKAPEPVAAPKRKAAAPVKLATTLEGFPDKYVHLPREPSPATNNMPRRNRWLSKEETKAMRSRPLSDCVIDEDAYDGEIQNNDWPSADENSPELCLRQWDGGWLPAPLDWQARNQYKSLGPDKFAEDIATWVNRTNNHYLVIQDGTSKITVKIVDANGKIITRENVPRSWVPENIEGKSLQEFWNCLLQSSPEPLEGEDVRFAPFWQRYITQAHNSDDQELADFQESLPGPEPKLDVADCGVILYQRAKNQTADMTSKQVLENKLKDAARDTARKEAIKQKQYKSMRKEAKRPVAAPPPNPHKPAANVYLRPATNRDDAQMALIYNHYANTHYSSAMAPITAAEMETRRRDVAAANLNMIVAVLKVKQTGGQRANLQSTQEKIVGFAYTDEHEGPRSLFRYAADLEVFVHPDYARKGVGKSLVDRLMFLADSFYVSRDAVEWRPMSDDLHLVNAGGKRSLGTVHINVFYPSDDAERLVWLQTWLQQFDFGLRAKIEGGIKLQKNVNMATFVHKNGLAINPISARD